MAAKALSNRQLLRAAGIVILGFLASGVLGLARTAAFSAVFGASDALDAFLAAQRIPELLYVLVAGGALGSSFIPVFTRYLTAGDRVGAWRMASAVMTCAAAVGAVLALIVVLLAPALVPMLLVPEATPEMQALTTSLTQLMMVTVVIFTISGLLMGILNAESIFTLPALALSFNNLGQIFAALVIVPLLPADENVRIYGLAYGAILGSLGHLLVQIPGLPRIDARLRFLLDPRTPGVGDVLRLMLPRVLGLAVTQINFVVNVALTSGMVEGSRTALVFAWQLMFFALGVIAQSVGTAVFPTLSAMAAAGDMDGYKDRLASALRGVLFLAFPMTIGLILLGQPLIAVLLERGEWTAAATVGTAWALAFFAIGIAGHSLLEVLSRAFYALGDTRTPVAVGLASMVSNIALSLIFIRFIGDPASLTSGPFAGLALANSLTTLIEGILLWGLLRRRIGAIHDMAVVRTALRALLAALGMGALLVAVRSLMLNAPLIELMLGGAVGVVGFFALGYALGLDEARTIPALVLRRLKRG